MEKNKIKSFLLEIFFPKICLNCQKEGNYLCEDCLALLEISTFHQKHSTKNLNDLYFALPYQKLIKKIIQKFKYQPFVRELSEVLAKVIITHFQLLDNEEDLGDIVDLIRHPGQSEDFVLVPVPLAKKRLRWRGFNQVEEIGKHLSFYFKIPLVNNVLIKIKETPPQIELNEKERKGNVLRVFYCQNSQLIKNKKVILLDDVYTTGSTMEECARVLKEAKAKKIIGIVVARSKIGEDKLEDI